MQRQTSADEKERLPGIGTEKWQKYISVVSLSLSVIMAKVVASHPYCVESSTQLTRPASDTFYRIDGSNDPTIIDKHQAKRLYRLQRAPNNDTRLHLDNSDVDNGPLAALGQFQYDASRARPPTSVYHRPTDMSNATMSRFSLGKTRIDPQRTIPREITTVRDHPHAITILRHEQGAENEVVPRWTDRMVRDGTLRGRLGPGGTLNPEEDCKQAQLHLRSQGPPSSQEGISYDPTRKRRPLDDELKRDALARHYMYTSTQQAAFDEIPWDSKLAPKLPVPLTTYEAEGSDPILTSKHLTSLNDARTRDILEWDRVQSRNVQFYRKPIENVAPLPRAYQISGYSGCIGGYHIQDIDDPTVNFQPLTVLRSEQPKFALNPFKTNLPFYTGKCHWTKTDPVSHYDQAGHPYTTTAAFHKPLTVDYSTYRHADLNGELSRAVTTVVPQNPFNLINANAGTTNASLDSRPHVNIPTLPASSITSTKKTQREEGPSGSPPPPAAAAPPPPATD